VDDLNPSPNCLPLGGRLFSDLFKTAAKLLQRYKIRIVIVDELPKRKGDHLLRFDLTKPKGFRHNPHKLP
jgi:hypothetical protein